MKVYVGSIDVWVVVAGVVVMLYPVAPYDGVHARSTVVISPLPSARLVIAFGMTKDDEVLVPPVPNELMAVTLTV